MNISAMSVSRHGVWDECQKRYLYQYHLKLPIPEEKFHFTYGKLIHRSAELYVQNKGKTSIFDFAKQLIMGKIPLEESRPGVADKQEQEIKPINHKLINVKRLNQNLGNIVRLMDKIGNFDGMTETAFEFNLGDREDRPVRGVIDYMYEKNGMVSMLDYKTTQSKKWRETRESIAGNLQLRTYAKFLNKKHNVPVENIQAALVYVDEDDPTFREILIPTRFTQESIDAAEQTLLDAYEQIVSTKPEKAVGRTGFHCHQCDWKNICPDFKVMSYC